MYVTIYAESLNNYSTGKTSRVWAEPSGITFAIDESESTLAIKAQCVDYRNSGDRGGDYNPVTRQLQIQLTAEDLAALTRAATASPTLIAAQAALLGEQFKQVIAERDGAVSERDRLYVLLERYRQVTDDSVSLLQSVETPRK